MNKKEISLKNKLYYEKNKGKILITRGLYYEENREEIIVKNSDYSKDNRETRREYERSRRSANKVKINKVKSDYEKQKRQNNPSHKLRKNVSRLVNFALFKNNSKKNNLSILNFLSYSMEELKLHLERQFEYWMTWDNYGSYDVGSWNDNNSETWTWQLDHIVPQSKLPYISMQDENFKKCWSLENLRPLSAKKNIIDGNRR